MGTAVLFMAWLPALSKKIKISYPLLLLGIGFLIYYLEIPLQWPDPYWPDDRIMMISELIVVISLMAAGLKIPVNASFNFWKVPFRFICIAMPITMIGVYFLGTEMLELSFASAILLAAVMAPTDPVLAAEVQLEAPEHQDEELPKSEFVLTAEAGLNDGMAFPFTYLAVLIIQAGSWESFSLTGWLWNEFALKIILGIVFGYIFAKIVIFSHSWLCKVLDIKTQDGLLAFALAIVAFAGTELLHGYGFLAVFVASITLKHSKSINNDYKEKLHAFVDEVERFLLIIWIVLFGGSIISGILKSGGWDAFWVALLLIFIIRPVAGVCSLLGKKMRLKEKLLISFFGIRGIGSLFYLSWAFYTIGDYDDRPYLYGIVSVFVLSSIVIHGLSAPFLFVRKKNSDKD